MRKIAVCGKGGVGKSFIVYGFAKVLAKKGYKVLVVDVDESNQSLYKLFGFSEPPASFMDFLGGKKAVSQQLRKKFQAQDKEVKISVIEEKKFHMNDIPKEFIKSDGNIHLLSIGKIKEPMEGCACPMGVVSREFLEKIELSEDELILVDTEAGIEHFGRGVEKGVDTIVAVAEPYLDSIEVAEKAIVLAKEMGKKTYLIINKVPAKFENKILEILQRKGLTPAGIIHFSEEVYTLSLEGKATLSAKVFEEIEKSLDSILMGVKI
ncbi:ATP-binding protein [Thermodesulfovibrio hydrogeniphilus]